eukprot:CAMPEP_0177593740 /NCGR_PEP_ID=MMETSP0419_2-20121207/9349_1 /TAXON_ID=582737 /ORGANISM="Tetraselmis sp., Strain GSL018" /LENGTH=379 /DNA_ID=CAMNT_0019084883 /DNA_START=75 /DNA_END=1214 /DNA_ORIENTATION=-
MRIRLFSLAIHIATFTLVLVSIICSFEEELHFITDSESNINLNEVRLEPTFEVADDGQEYVWQLPASKVNGVILLAPGCHHAATDFWDKQRGCEDCIGLPEEKRIVRTALSRGYAVIAVSAGGRGFNPECWDVTFPTIDESSDISPTIFVLQTWLREKSLSHVPVYAIGASSGGAFVLVLALRFPFAAVCSQIMAAPPNVFRASNIGDAEEGRTWKYPPTLFVHMPRDSRTAARVKHGLSVLHKEKVPAKELRVMPKPLTPSFLSERITSMPKDTSAAIYAVLREAGTIDERGFLREDPRSPTSGWREALRALQGRPGLAGDSLAPDESPIAEELNVLYARHEIVSDFMQETLDWFEASLGSTLQAHAEHLAHQAHQEP